MTKIVVPPIKSQGIKTKLVPHIIELAPKTNGRWVEPFLGTGVVAFNCGYENFLLNDINPHIINFYEGIKNGTINSDCVRSYLNIEGEKLKSLGNEQYLEIRRRFNDNFSPYDFLFLSRAGFNGMIRFNSKGKWNIPFCKKPDRFSKAYTTKIVNQVDNVSKLINNDWTFTCHDFKETLLSVKSNDMVYLDPPYTGRYVDYYNGWSEKNEDELFEILKSAKYKFILSTWHSNQHRKNSLLDRYSQLFNVKTISHFYHVGASTNNRSEMLEALIYNF